MATGPTQINNLIDKSFLLQASTYNMSGKILIGSGHVPTPWTVTVAKFGLTSPQGWGILLYHYCFLITILLMNITTVTAAAAVGWTEIRREYRLEDQMERQ